MRDNVVDVVIKEDLEHIYILWKYVFDINQTIEEFTINYNKIFNKENSDLKILAYYIDNIPIGTVQININRMLTESEAVLWYVCVDEKYRRRKIATKLLQKAEEVIKSEYNVGRIWLFSGFKRECAHKLYKSLDYDENRDKAFVKFIK